MFLTTQQAVVLPQVIRVLAEPQPEATLRLRLGELLMRLLQADQFVSYVWDPGQQCFGERVAIDMSDDNLRQYESYYQFHDPITHPLRARGRATLVTEIMAQAALVKTEFFNDFLARDALYWGVNVHVHVGGETTGDIRLWRTRRRGNFDQTDLALLSIVAPAFSAALSRCRDCASPSMPVIADANNALRLGLTPKEGEIAHMVTLGLSDKQIATRLGISFSTVRTHIKHVFHKLGVNNRTQLIRVIG
ncbi:helix-turn-helix transcriptional regulator [Paraburkholderia sp. J12]|uniref:helix-turn-helix transcriptional regulator n=1 Tax=Paraburkholderia sp. J12 TaxID=2805432 RepID=UPI002ABE0225|nr:LuxR C-terminal-related transcriptional regulator [Paraburkholderia sp. J12]